MAVRGDDLLEPPQQPGRVVVVVRLPVPVPVLVPVVVPVVVTLGGAHAAVCSPRPSASHLRRGGRSGGLSPTTTPHHPEDPL